MDLARTSQVFLIVTLGVASLVKFYDTAQTVKLDREGRRLAVWLASAFGLLAAGSALSLPNLVPQLDDITTMGFTKVLYNVATVYGLAALLAFFYLSARGTATSRGRTAVATTLASAIVISAAMVVCVVATPARFRNNSVLHPDGAQMPVLAFYAIGGAWFVWAALRSGWFAGQIARASTGILARATALIAIGLLLSAAASAVRLGIVAVSAAGGSGPALRTANAINFGADNTAKTLPAVGLCLFAWVRFRDFRRRRRLCRALQPLRIRLRKSFPELALPQATHRVMTLVKSPGTASTRSNYDRSLIEIWDGLLRLSAPLSGAVAGRDPDDIGAAEIAAVIMNATATNPPKGADEAVAPSSRLLQVMTADERDRGLEAGVEFLAAVSQSLDPHRISAQREARR